MATPTGPSPDVMALNRAERARRDTGLTWAAIAILLLVLLIAFTDSSLRSVATAFGATATWAVLAAVLVLVLMTCGVVVRGRRAGKGLRRTVGIGLAVGAGAVTVMAVVAIATGEGAAVGVALLLALLVLALVWLAQSVLRH